MQYDLYNLLDNHKISEKRIQHSLVVLNEQKDKVYQTNKRAVGTRVRYKQTFGQFIDHIANTFALKNIKNIQPKHIESYVDYLVDEGYAASTIETNLSAVRFSHGLIDKPKYAELPTNTELKIKERVAELEKGRSFTEKEYVEFEKLCLRLSRQDVLDASRLAMNLGLRINEVTVLKKDRVEHALRTNVLELRRGDGTKGNRPRKVPVTAEARRVLEDINNRTARGRYVIKQEVGGERHKVKKSIGDFMYNHRSKYQDEESSKVLVNIKGKGETEIERTLSFHSFRYTFAQNSYYDLIESGCSKEKAEYVVAEMLGHGRPEITRRYL